MRKAAVIEDGDPQGPEHVQGGTTEQSNGTPTDDEHAEGAEVDHQEGNADSRDLPLRNTRSCLEPGFFRC